MSPTPVGHAMLVKSPTGLVMLVEPPTGLVVLVEPPTGLVVLVEPPAGIDIRANDRYLFIGLVKFLFNGIGKVWQKT